MFDRFPFTDFSEREPITQLRVNEPIGISMLLPWRFVLVDAFTDDLHLIQIQSSEINSVNNSFSDEIVTFLSSLGIFVQSLLLLRNISSFLAKQQPSCTVNLKD